MDDRYLRPAGNCSLGPVLRDAPGTNRSFSPAFVPSSFRKQLRAEDGLGTSFFRVSPDERRKSHAIKLISMKIGFLVPMRRPGANTSYGQSGNQWARIKRERVNEQA
jgi:hypothetical protein